MTDQLQGSKFTIWVSAVSIFALLLPIAIIEWIILKQTDGIFAYPVDDTFIHLAIAKNLAFHHIWGISPHQFVSASSSLLYPIILCLVIKIAGLHAIIPFIINVIIAIILLLVVQKWLSRQDLKPISQLIILLCLIFLTPLPILVISGMEHTLQLLFYFLFISQFSNNLEKITVIPIQQTRLSWSVYLYGALMTATRYEGIFVIGTACFLLIFRRKVWQALFLGVITLLPIIVFGCYAIGKGNYFMPNSVLLKSGIPTLTFKDMFDFITDLLYFRLSHTRAGYNIIASQRLALILPITYFLVLKWIKSGTKYHTFFYILLIGLCVQLTIGTSIRFPRYEAYLIGTSTLFVGVLWTKYGKTILTGSVETAKYACISIAFMLLLPAVFRSRFAFTYIAQSCINIYEQQYQMGEFLNQYYNNESVAINDIGAVSYLTEGNNLDLLGIGNITIAKSIKANYNTPTYLNSLCKKDKIKISIIYTLSFSPELYKDWVPVALWQIPNNVACGDDIVFFYAIDPASKPDLLKNLQIYQKRLPAEVKVQYY